MINILKIADYLYVSFQIGKHHAEELVPLKFPLIISMMGQIKVDNVYTQPPFKSVWIPTYDMFFTPIPTRILLVGVSHGLPIIQKGGKVLVLCMEGRCRF